MSAATIKRQQAQLRALKEHLAQRSTANPTNLSRAYGLALPLVSKLMREMGVQIA